MNAQEQKLAQAKKALVSMIGNFIGNQQAAVLADSLRGEERYGIADMVLEVWERIRAMPQSYETNGKSANEVMVQLHYFMGGMDAWITEKDMGATGQWTPVTPQMQAYGLVSLGDYPELGYVSIRELIDNDFELDLHWTLKSLAEVKEEAMQ